MASLRPYQVLRRIYDASPEQKAGGLLRRDVAGRRAVLDWLTGAAVGGGPSSVAGVTPTSSVEERVTLTTAWLDEIRTLAGVHYMAPGQKVVDQPPAPGGGVFSVERTREVASRTPLFRDVAPDVYWAAAQLTTLVQECRDEALAPRDPAPATWPEAPPRDIEIPPGPGTSF
jgi:hypothetical protein